MKMNRQLKLALAAGFLAWAGGVQAQLEQPRLQTPRVDSIDVLAQALAGNSLGACRISGSVTLWVSRRVEVLDDMRESLGALEAGLAQFSQGSQLAGCVPDGAALDLSDQFVNFLLADDRPIRGGLLGRERAGGLATQLAADFYHLAESDRRVIPLVAGVDRRAIGSVSHQFVIVLIVDGARYGSFDAVIQRETTRTKFSPRLPDDDRHLSRLTWSSTRWRDPSDPPFTFPFALSAPFSETSK